MIVAFLSVVTFPVMECYVTKPDCPERQTGPCPYGSGAPTCASMSLKPCEFQATGDFDSIRKDAYKYSSKFRPLFFRLTIPVSIRSQSVVDQPVIQLWALWLFATEPQPLERLFSAYIPDRHPRAGPLILLNRTFLI
jgi:hypothetical protein